MPTISEKQFENMLKTVPADMRDNLEQQYHAQDCQSSENVTEKINSLHRSLCDTMKITITKAIQIGELLSQQKEKLEHGYYTKWIEEELDFTVRTAQNYVRIYNNRDLIVKNENVSCLSDAYRLLAEPKDVETDDPESDPTPADSTSPDQEDQDGDTEEFSPEEQDEESPQIITKDDIAKPNLHATTAHKLLTNDSYPVGYACLACEQRNEKIHLYLKKSTESVLRYSFKFDKGESICDSKSKIANVYYMKLYAESDSDADKFNEYEAKIQEIEESQQQKQTEIEEEKNYDIAAELGLSG